MTKRLLAITFIALSAAAACERERDTPAPPPPAVPAAPDAAVETAVPPAPEIRLEEMTRTPSGLHVLDLREGEGEVVRAGQTVLLHYRGWLLDGPQFDASYARGRPLDVVIGVGDVIRGWDEGVPGMRVGGQRRLVVPPQLGHGATGVGDIIPPDATLVYDIEVVAIVRN